MNTRTICTHKSIPLEFTILLTRPEEAVAQQHSLNMVCTLCVQNLPFHILCTETVTLKNRFLSLAGNFGLFSR